MIRNFKIIIFVTLSLFAVLFVLLTLGKLFRNPIQQEVTPTPSPYPSFSPIPSVQMDDVNVPTVPLTDTFLINSVSVKNFYPFAKDTNINGDVLVADDPSYHIVYFPFRKTFLINILSSPFEDARIKAEEKFLETLGITKLEACKLSVEVSTPRFANEDLAGQTFPLSFCENVTE